MRIIGGTARGRKLAGFSGDSIRPTPDRVREAVFSSLFSRVGGFRDKRVLDLFAGTGAMAIEALSRGAAAALLVDHGRESAQLVARNLQATGLGERAAFLPGKIPAILPRIAGRGPFDLIFIDPPYAHPDIAGILQCVNDLGLLHSDGMMCVETASATDLPEKVGQLERCLRRQYGSTAVSYYCCARPGDDSA